MKFVIALALVPAALPAENLIDRGYRQMYNLQFREAHLSFQQWEQEHPGDPLGPVSDAAAYLFSEFDRLHILESEFFTDDRTFTNPVKLKPDPAVKQAFDAALRRAQTAADRILAKSPNDRGALFVTILRLGLHSDYAGLIEKRYLAALSDTKQSRMVAEKLLAAHPECYDAHLATGVENYMLSLKPAPMRFLLRLGGARTDKATGIRQLRITAEKGHYLLPFARLLLAVAALRDGDRAGARASLTWLANEYPGNPLYRKELAKLQ